MSRTSICTTNVKDHQFNKNEEDNTEDHKAMMNIKNDMINETMMNKENERINTTMMNIENEITNKTMMNIENEITNETMMNIENEIINETIMNYENEMIKNIVSSEIVENPKAVETTTTINFEHYMGNENVEARTRSSRR